MRHLSLRCALFACVLFLGISSGPAGAGEEDPIQLMPAELAQGSEVLTFIFRQPGSVDRRLNLRSPSGDVFVLDDVVTDRFGNALSRAPLPDVPPGDYVVELATTRQVLASTTLRVLSAPQITLNPKTGVGGEKITLDVSGLAPGRVTVFVNDQPVVGPAAVMDGSMSRTIAIPDGGMAALPVRVENRVGDRLVGSAGTSFQRLRTENNAVEAISARLPAEPLSRGVLQSITGQIRVPDGVQPEAYLWTMVLIQEGGAMTPISVEPFQFTPSSGKGGGNIFDYNARVVMPSLLAGFSLVELNRETDKFGVVYQPPQTGSEGNGASSFQDGLVNPLEGPIAIKPSGTMSIIDQVNYGDEQGILITGRVIDSTDSNPATQGIEDAIIAVDAETTLIYPSDIGKNAVEILSDNKAAPDELAYARSTAAMMARTQIADAMEKLSAPPPLDTGCPVTLQTKATDANGEYSIAFSPEVTDLLQAFREFAIKNAEADIAYGTVPAAAQDRFIIRIGALHLDEAFGIPATLALNSYTGVRYDFERTDAGRYFICSNFDEDCEVDGFEFNPVTDVLTTPLDPAPSGITKPILSKISIEGLAPPVDGPLVAGFSTAIWDGLLTFPNQANNPDINQKTLTIKVDWLPVLFGAPGPDGATVSIDGLPGSFSLVLAPGLNPCDPSGVAYAAEIPGLAVRNGPITGEINIVVGETLFRKDIQISTVPGPTWHEDPNKYLQPASITWSPQEATIVAQEFDKSVDANKDFGDTLDLGNIKNDNAETNTTVVQTFMVGGTLDSLPSRKPNLEVNVINEGGPVELKALKLGPETAFMEESFALRRFGADKGSVASLLDREGNPTFGSKDPDTLFSQFTPLFRYAWGVPPIAAAVLGADLIFGAKLVYFGYINANTSSIEVDSLAEPSTFLILNVFFDFSAIFGLVSASMEAAPEIGVGMPVVVSNSVFDTQASQACFEFLLKLTFQVSVGPCPLCVGASYTDTPVDEETPNGCVIAANAKAGLAQKAIVTPPSADSIGLATNGMGTTFVASTDSTGVTLQQVNAGIPGPVFALASGRGAMQPEVTFYRAAEAVTVWSQTGLSDAAFDMRVNSDYDCTEADLLIDPNCADQQQFDASQFQHLVYAQWDGNAWGPTLDLTPPMTTMGEGGVKLAACAESAYGCPVGGEVLAVWHRAMNTDLDAHEIKLYYAFFDGLAWSTPTGIDLAVPGKDLQPSPLYVNGEPAMVWVRNQNPLDTGGGLQTNNRELVYRFLRAGAGTQVVTNAPASVASPSAAAVGNQIFLTYTSSLPGSPFVGTRRALYGTVGTNCNGATGFCGPWLTQKQKDQHGRDIYVEKPRLILTSDNTPLVAHRWLSTGGPLMPDDPFGVTGLGDTAMHVLALPDVTIQDEVDVSALTADGLVNWQTAGLFDPSVGSAIVISAQAEQVAVKSKKFGFTARPIGGVRRQKLGTARSLTLFEMGDTPDLTIKSASVAGSPVVTGNDVITLRARLANLGTPLRAGGPVTLDVWMDGPPGAGQLLVSESAIVLTDPVGTDVEFTADIPSQVSSDELHLLYLVVNDGFPIAESNGDNNLYRVTLNRLPAPQNLDSMIDAGGTTAFVLWDAPLDPRISGYRVYRRNAGESQVIQIGVSPRTGFADMRSFPNRTYDYCVASLTDSMMESACSEWITVDVRALPGTTIFLNGFE